MKIINKILLTIICSTFCFSGNIEAQRTGVEIWAQTCGNCHMIQPPARYNALRWPTIMTHMKITARLTDDEASAVLEFLMQGAMKTPSIGSTPNSDSNKTNSSMITSVNSKEKSLNVNEDELTQQEINAKNSFMKKQE